MLPAGHTLHSSAGNAIKASPAPGIAGAHEASESAIANVLDDNFFYIGQIVGTTLVNASSLLGAKREALWLQLVADGLDDTVSYETAGVLQSAIDTVIGSLNMLALPPAYMITPVDWVAHQPLPPLVPPPVPAVPAPGLAGVPVGVAVGGAAPARAEQWVERMTVENLSDRVDTGPGGPPLMRTTRLGRWRYYTPGTWVSLDRDAPGSPLRVMAGVARLAAYSAGFTNASQFNSLHAPAVVCDAVGQWFASIQQAHTSRLDTDEGPPHLLSRRTDDFMMLHFFTCNVVSAFRIAVSTRFIHLGPDFDELIAMLAPFGHRNLPAQRFLLMLDACRATWLEPPKGGFGSKGDLLQLQACARKVLDQVNADANAVTGDQRVAIAARKLSDLRAAEAAARRGGGGSGAAAAGGGSRSSAETGELFRRLSLPAFTATAVACFLMCENQFRHSGSITLHSSHLHAYAT